MPPVTFPAHTTIITGVHPACHGIANNRKLPRKRTATVVLERHIYQAAHALRGRAPGR